MAHIRLFISAVSNEFLSYRDSLRKLLQRHDVTIQIQEDFVAGALPTLDKLDLYIRDCDGVIHLVGDMTGAPALRPSVDLITQRYPDLAARIPDLGPAIAGGGRPLSYTQWEAYLAIYHARPLLIAVPAKGAAREPTRVLDPAQESGQRDHLERLQRGERFPEITFLDEKDLALGVYRSTIHDLLIRAGIESASALLGASDAERRHKELLDAIGRDKGVDPKHLIPILENLGYQQPGISPADIPHRLSERVDALRAAAAEPLKASNAGEDIERVRRESRSALYDAKTDQALAILNRQLEIEREAMEDHRRRTKTLLWDKAEVERLRYDYAAVRTTLQEVLRLDPDDAWSWILLGRDWITVGSLADAANAFEAALKVARRTGQARDEGAALNELGEVLVAQGNLEAALALFRDGRAIFENLARTDPGNMDSQHDLSVSYSKIGDALAAQGDLEAALKAFHVRRAIADDLAKSDPGNTIWQRELSASYDKVGDVLVAQGNLDAALISFRDGLAIAKRLAKSDPGNAGWQRDLSASYDRVGDVALARGHYAEALGSFRDSLAIRERLAESAPDNTRWQRDLSASHDLVGTVLVAQGNLDAALASFRASLAIRDRLARAGPGNMGWQRDLSVSYNKIAGVLVAQGKLDAALTLFRASLGIFEHLIKVDPGNTDWQRDLSVSYNNVGYLLVRQNNLGAALTAFRDSLAIAERLAKTDPGNAIWQADLAADHGQLGQLHVVLGEKAEALRLFKAGRAILAPLVERTGHRVWIGYLNSFNAEIAALEQQ
jgi:tetratricopeptide (TPR) repeat protein